MPLQRAADEMYRALYHKESNLRRKGKDGKYTVPIKEGLFSKLSYKRDETIATFKGTIRTQEEYIAIWILHTHLGEKDTPSLIQRMETS